MVWGAFAGFPFWICQKTNSVIRAHIMLSPIITINSESRLASTTPQQANVAKTAIITKTIQVHTTFVISKKSIAPRKLYISANTKNDTKHSSALIAPS